MRVVFALVATALLLTFASACEPKADPANPGTCPTGTDLRTSIIGWLGKQDNLARTEILTAAKREDGSDALPVELRNKLLNKQGKYVTDRTLKQKVSNKSGRKWATFRRFAAADFTDENAFAIEACIIGHVVFSHGTPDEKKQFLKAFYRRFVDGHGQGAEHLPHVNIGKPAERAVTAAYGALPGTVPKWEPIWRVCKDVAALVQADPMNRFITALQTGKGCAHRNNQRGRFTADDDPVFEKYNKCRLAADVQTKKLIGAGDLTIDEAAPAEHGALQPN